MEKQVDKKHYGPAYIHKPRWLSYYLQIKSVLDLLPGQGRVLLVGVGDGVALNYLKRVGFEVVTFDIDSELKPDCVGDIRQTEFADGFFDLVLCAEVLEHLPFADFEAALKEIRRLTKRYAVISLPDSRSTLINLKLKLPFLRERRIFLKTGNFKKHVFDSQHWWEIGKRGYGLDRIKQAISRSGFKLVDNFVDPDSPTIHFFILGK